MAQKHTVRLTLRGVGKEIHVYDRYSIAIDMLDAGNPVTFSLWYSQENDNGWNVLMENVKIGDQMVFTIDDAVQCVSRIEDFEVDVDTQQGARIIISGRDLAGPAISWDAKPTLVLRNSPLDEVLQSIFKGAGLTVSVGDHADAEREVRGRVRPGRRGSTAAGAGRRRNQVDLSHPRPNETMWQVAESVVKRLGYMMWVAPGENDELVVVVDKPAYNTPPVFRFERRILDGRVTQSSNILWSRFKKSVKDIPTDVYTFGRGQRADGTPSRVCGHYRNTLLDGDARVYQPFTTQPKYLHSRRARNPATAEQEARRYCAQRNAKYQLYTIGVQGHSQEVNGSQRIYTVNTMAGIVDDVTRLNEDMLIQRVEFDGEFGGGQVTTLVLGRKDAINLEPEAS